MAQIFVDHKLITNCTSHCLYCIVSDVCNRETVELTNQEFEMLQTCSRRGMRDSVSCDSCKNRFLCYTSKVNNYAVKPYLIVSDW